MLFLSLIALITFFGCTAQPKKNVLSSSEKFNTTGHYIDAHLNELKEVFGKDVGYEITSPFGVNNNYDFELRLNKVEPMSQSSFDNIKERATPFIRKILNNMKELGTQNPEINLKILNKIGSPLKGSENLITTYKIKL